LLSAGVAGVNTSHGAEDNLYKIRLFLEGDINHTFGLDELLPDATFEEAYEAVACHTGHPPDREENPGSGCIDPSRTAAALVAAGDRIRAVAESGGRLLFGTGHPGALILYYANLGRWVEDLGGRSLTVEVENRYKKNSTLDWVGPVAVLGDGATLYHAHDYAPMQDALDRIDAVDLVVADHGFAGAAIAAGIPTVAIMDTNDPALAVASDRGRDLTVIPMDDNRPPNSYTAALDVLMGDPRT
jgi:hypothetical protein